LALILTWLWEVAVFGILRLPQFPASILDGFLGPALAAFTVTGLTEGRAGVRELLARCVTWRVGVSWYLVVLAGPAALFLLSALATPGVLLSVHVPGVVFGVRYLGLYVVILLFGGALSEEPGWRGYALPRLQQRCGPLWGSVILGTVMGVWHLPLYAFVPGFNEAGTGGWAISLAFGEFVLVTIPFSIVFTWVANNTRASVLLTMLLHASGNSSGPLVFAFFPHAGASTVTQVYFAAVALTALLLVVVTRRGACL
jgi:membrane protease YdiL (CAAX protease family)